MIDIKTYIKRGTMIKRSYVVVDNMDEAENMAKRVSCGENLNLKFTTYSIKNRFMQELSIQCPGVVFINCNSSKDKFFNNVYESYNKIIYNNVEKCQDEEILEFISKKRGVFVC